LAVTVLALGEKLGESQPVLPVMGEATRDDRSNIQIDRLVVPESSQVAKNRDESAAHAGG
jgi:hypothetical protein